jgi:hypothetical protein
MRVLALLSLSAVGVVLAAPVPNVVLKGLSCTLFSAIKLNDNFTDSFLDNDVLKRDGSTEFDADLGFFRRG